MSDELIGRLLFWMICYHTIFTGLAYQAMIFGSGAMTFSQAVQTVFSKYATFTGRAARPEFWWWVLFVFILLAILNIIDGFIVGPILGLGFFGPESGQPLSAIASLALLIPNIAVGVRRLHDIGRSGWWLLLNFIPLIGFLILLYWFIQPSQVGQNQYS